MAYDKTKYTRYRSLGLNHVEALALADDNFLKPGPARPAIADLAGGADLATTVAKVNALLATLRTAGIIAP